jgi:UDPglucose 6-dehydrogenase
MASRIAIVGCGHVGLVFAAGLAELGHRVVGVDRDPALIASLGAGEVHIHEPGLPELVACGLGNGLLSFTTSYDEAIPAADFIFLAVDTPPTVGGAADLRNMRAAMRSIALSLNGRAPIIVNKSTSPIGTGETIEGILQDALGGRQKHPRIVSNPEFLRQSRAVQDFFHPDRIVIGARSPVDAAAVAELYAGLGGELILTDLRTAEMIKYVANSFLATRVSFINEVSRLCEELGVDVDRVIEGVAPDPRIGGHFFQPGIGFGGSCLPKDVAALRYMGEALGVATPVLSAVMEVNKTQRTAALRKLRSALGGRLDGRVIGVWGVTFKGGTEDVRESPAMELITMMLNEGVEVRAYDPSFAPQATERVRETLVATPLEAVTGADALAILSDWDEFREVPLAPVRAAMRGDVLFDGRNVIARADAELAGLVYLGIGRGRPFEPGSGRSVVAA